MGVKRGRRWERQAVAVLTKVIHRLLVRHPKKVRRAMPLRLRQRGGWQMLNAVVESPLLRDHFWWHTTEVFGPGYLVCWG